MHYATALHSTALRHWEHWRFVIYLSFVGKQHGATNGSTVLDSMYFYGTVTDSTIIIRYTNLNPPPPPPAAAAARPAAATAAAAAAVAAASAASVAFPDSLLAFVAVPAPVPATYPNRPLT